MTVDEVICSLPVFLWCLGAVTMRALLWEAVCRYVGWKGAIWRE